jgi:hypothetical protein
VRSATAALLELRQYRVLPGRRDEWVKLMDEVIVPFQIAKGMVIGTFIADNDPDLYVWIRRFENEDERQQLYEAVYESEEWKSDIAPRTAALLGDERMTVTRLRPTSKSPLR